MVFYVYVVGLFFLLRENNEVLIEVLIDIVVDATDKITECQETLYSPNLLICNFVRSINDNIDENIDENIDCYGQNYRMSGNTI